MKCLAFDPITAQWMFSWGGARCIRDAAADGSLTGSLEIPRPGIPNSAPVSTVTYR